MPLTDVQVKSFKPQAKRVRKSDGGGLYIEVSPNGVRTFRLAYRFAGVQHTLLVGFYPDMRLAEARLVREQAKAALRQGTDPRAELTVAPPAPAPATAGFTWNEIADDYLLLRTRDNAAPKTLRKLKHEIDLTRAAFGARLIGDIKAPDIIALVRPIETSGRVETAHMVRTRCSQLFQFAIAEGKTESDPASLIGGAMAKRTRIGYSALVDPAKVGKLMASLRTYHGEPQVRAGLLLSAYLFPRSLELRGMRWEEIDWDARLWSVPAERMKMKRPHLVPLPRQALAVLTDLKAWTGKGSLAIPTQHDPEKMLSENTFNKALTALGAGKGIHVQHGFRKTMSTTLNEAEWNSDWIERQLAHIEGNKVRKAYNQAEYLEGRAEMMQAYADWLDEQEKKFGGDDAGKAQRNIRV
jgi:integrase